MKLSEAIRDELARHAVETYPDECCGVLVAKVDGELEVRRLTNVQNEMHEQDPKLFPRTARIAYYPDPGELFAALRHAEEPGNTLAAFYHSHPDHDAYFSEEDLAQATPLGEPSYPEAVQIVISVYEREVRDVKAFAWSAEASDYIGVELAVR